VKFIKFESNKRYLRVLTQSFRKGGYLGEVFVKIILYQIEQVLSRKVKYRVIQERVQR
jgi:hypothetical protein